MQGHPKRAEGPPAQAVLPGGLVGRRQGPGRGSQVVGQFGGYEVGVAFRHVPLGSLVLVIVSTVAPIEWLHVAW